MALCVNHTNIRFGDVRENETQKKETEAGEWVDYNRFTSFAFHRINLENSFCFFFYFAHFIKSLWMERKKNVLNNNKIYLDLVAQRMSMFVEFTQYVCWYNFVFAFLEPTKKNPIVAFFFPFHLIPLLIAHIHITMFVRLLYGLSIHMKAKKKKIKKVIVAVSHIPYYCLILNIGRAKICEISKYTKDSW